MENLIYYLTIGITVFLIFYLVYLFINKDKLSDLSGSVFSKIGGVFDKIDGITEIMLIIGIISIIIDGIVEIVGIGGIINVIVEIIGIISAIIFSINGIINGIDGIGDIVKIFDGKLKSRQIKKIKKNYPKLSIVGIIRQRKSNQKLRTIYLLLITTIIYIFTSKFFDFTTSKIFLGLLLGNVLLISLESLIFKYRINRGWYGSSESEAREIIDFILKNSEDIDLTNGNSPKPIIEPEGTKEIAEERGIQSPGYPQPDIINKNFSEG